jgi:hypothetical protein
MPQRYEVITSKPIKLSAKSMIKETKVASETKISTTTPYRFAQIFGKVSTLVFADFVSQECPVYDFKGNERETIDRVE